MKFIVFLLFKFSICVLGTSPGVNVDINQSEIQKLLFEETKNYLYKFGYTVTSDKKPPSLEQTQEALKKFQSAFLNHSSGKVDSLTQSKMNEWRCANNDMSQGKLIPAASKKELWTKKKLTWKIVANPSTLSANETESGAREAFDKWAKAGEFIFIESPNITNPDITITFYDVPQSTFKIAASASKPRNSHIILDKNQKWAYKSLSGISLFHTLLHEIGHTLGLTHTFFSGSIMHPVFKPLTLPFGTMNDVPNVDRLTIRKLYGLVKVDELPVNSDKLTSKCVKLVHSVLAVNDSEWLIFLDNKVFKLIDRKFVDNGRLLQNVFPQGPKFVNATVSSDQLTLLFVERTIYGYEYDGVNFTPAPNYPKELHERVLFYPQGAFPLNNGSIVLLSGNVFATYNVITNSPSLLNDKKRYFPNLPEDLKSGIEQTRGSTDAYWMFDEATVTNYDMKTKQVLQLQSISEFFKCL